MRASHPHFALGKDSLRGRFRPLVFGRYHDGKASTATTKEPMMGNVRFSGRRTSACPRVWRTDSSGRFLLSGPAREGFPKRAYDWGDDSDRCFALACDLLSSIGTPDQLAAELAPELALTVLASMPDEWELTDGQLALWRDTVPTFDVTILPANW